MLCLLSCSCLCPIHWSQVLSRNEDVVGAAPTSDAPTTSERSTLLLPSKVRLILEIWMYLGKVFSGLLLVMSFSWQARTHHSDGSLVPSPPPRVSTGCHIQILGASGNLVPPFKLYVNRIIAWIYHFAYYNVLLICWPNWVIWQDNPCIFLWYFQTSYTQGSLCVHGCAPTVSCVGHSFLTFK